jgi:hypothetical protein
LHGMIHPPGRRATPEQQQDNNNVTTPQQYHLSIRIKRSSNRRTKCLYDSK